MNNAANNIDAKAQSLRNLLKERRYKVDYFQREYKWQKDNIEDLINDLERSFFNNYDVNHSQSDVANYSKYYMGPVVLFQNGPEFSIVDGQQRLTSFTLLLIYLNHLLAQTLKIENKLDDYIFSNYYGKDSYNLNIPERVKILDKLFRNIEINEDDINNESSTNLLDRYEDITELFPITLAHKEILPLFINWLTEKLVFIEIITQTNDSAYTIFETMNDRGLNLTPTEMLKSYILSKSEDEDRIKELDYIWKTKIGILKTYSYDEDQDFFKAWFRAKYAITIRSTERGSLNEDFEKIGTRFHSWVQDNHIRILQLKSKEDFYNFIQSDFQFYSDLYITLISLIEREDIPEHPFRLFSYKGVSSSLSYPLILASIQKIDNQETIFSKINLSIKFLDAFSAYRLLLNDPITHSSIRNGMYMKVKEIRDAEFDILKDKLQTEINFYKTRFLNDLSYIGSSINYSKYILSRLVKEKSPEIPFENIYFQRRKDSYILYHFFTRNDMDMEVHKIPNALKDIFINSLCTYCVIPRNVWLEVDKMPLIKRIQYLIQNNFILEFSDINEFDITDLKKFFMERNKRMKSSIINLFKI